MWSPGRNLARPPTSAPPTLGDRAADAWVARWSYLGSVALTVVAGSLFLLASRTSGTAGGGVVSPLAVMQLCGVAAAVLTATLRGRRRGLALVAATVTAGVVAVAGAVPRDAGPGAVLVALLPLLVVGWAPVAIAAGSHLRRDLPEAPWPRALTGLGGLVLAGVIAALALPAYFHRSVWVRGHPPIAVWLPLVVAALLYAGLGVLSAVSRRDPHWISDRISAWGRALVLALPLGVLVNEAWLGGAFRGDVVFVIWAIAGAYGYVVVLGAGLVGIVGGAPVPRRPR